MYTVVPVNALKQLDTLFIVLSLVALIVDQHLYGVYGEQKTFYLSMIYISNLNTRFNTSRI
jgi:hypothetical protein